MTLGLSAGHGSWDVECPHALDPFCIALVCFLCQASALFSFLILPAPCCARLDEKNSTGIFKLASPVTLAPQLLAWPVLRSTPGHALSAKLRRFTGTEPARVLQGIAASRKQVTCFLGPPTEYMCAMRNGPQHARLGGGNAQAPTRAGKANGLS